MQFTEYDRFGPWVLPITDKDPLPPLFRSFQREIKQDITIKIPRPIDRGAANPSMDLYDFVLSFREKDLLILERKNKEVIQDCLPYGDIEGIIYSHQLLKGGLTLILPGRKVEIPFSTVSSVLMESCIQRIRDRADYHQFSAMGQQKQDVPLENLSFLFQCFLEKLPKETPAWRLLLAQTDLSLMSLRDKGWKGFVNRFLQRRLLESMHFTNGRELIVYDRALSIAKKSNSIYGKRFFYFPLEKIQSVQWIPDEKEGLLLLNIKHTSQTSQFYLERSNTFLPEYTACLDGLIQGRNSQ